jgi:hypothetical protein
LVSLNSLASASLISAVCSPTPLAAYVHAVLTPSQLFVGVVPAK